MNRSENQVGEYGVKELGEALIGGAKLFKAIREAKINDGKFGVDDLPLLINPMVYLPTALNGITQVPAEASEVYPSEFLTLETLLNDELADLPDGDLKERFRRHIEWVRVTHDLLREYYFPLPSQGEGR